MRKVLSVVVKDLRSEARGMETAPAMIFFGLTLVFLLTFALPTGGGRAPVPVPQAGSVGVREIAGVFLWGALLFAAVTGFSRTSGAEREGRRIDALVLAPVDPAALFLAKVAGNFIFLSLTELVMFPTFALLGATPRGFLFPGVILVAIVANVGMASIGTLFGAASEGARNKSLILPLLVFPALLPMVLGASRLTSSLLTAGGFANEAHWFILMAVYDLVFVVVGAVTYEFVIRE